MSKNNRELMVGLDIGTSNVTAVVGDVDVDGKINIVGFGRAPTHGLKRGVVVNIDATVQSIRQAVESAEVMAGCQINTAYAGMADGQVLAMNSQGMVPIKEGEVTPLDVHNVIDAAKTVAIPADRQILHILPQEFIIDQQDKIREPLGMSGVRLEAKVHMITGATSAMQNIAKSIKRCGLQVKDIILDQLASSSAVLTEEEKELGVCLVDIGAGTTDIMVIVGGAIQHSSVLPVGGDQVTNDLAIALRMPTQTAEKVKLEHACALEYLADPNYSVEVAAVGNCPAQTLTQVEMAQVVGPRYQEIFELIQSELREKGLEDLINAGVVITGGATQMPGVLELAQHLFDRPVRVGVPQNAGGLEEVIHDPSFATSVGLLMYAKQQRQERQNVRFSNEGVSGIWAKIKHWFQGNF